MWWRNCRVDCACRYDSSLLTCLQFRHRASTWRDGFFFVYKDIELEPRIHILKVHRVYVIYLRVKHSDDAFKFLMLCLRRNATSSIAQRRIKLESRTTRRSTVRVRPSFFPLSFSLSYLLTGINLMYSFKSWLAFSSVIIPIKNALLIWSSSFSSYSLRNETKDGRAYSNKYLVKSRCHGSRKTFTRKKRRK